MRERCTVVTLMLLVACRPVSQRPGQPPIRTDRDEYQVQLRDNIARATIMLKYTNGTGRTVYFIGCRPPHPPIIEKLVGDRWVSAWVPVVAACLSPPVAVDAGATYEYTFEMFAGLPGSTMHPQFEVAGIPGTYRLVWQIYADVDGDPSQAVLGRNPLPLAERVSNEFRFVR